MRSADCRNCSYKELAIRNDTVYASELVNYSNDKRSSPITLQADKTYLITGGTGGLGLELTKYLIAKGVKNIALVSRSGSNRNVEEVIRQNAAVNIKAFPADIADVASVKNLILSVETTMPEIAGVFHAAGILEDGTFENLTREQFENVMRPKAIGAWNLHEALLHKPLSCFVLFSSVAGILGISAQANYAGANSFLDSLAHYRRNNGLAATAVDFGTVAEIGLAAAADIRGERLKEQGLIPVSPARLTEIWDTVFSDNPIQIIFAGLDLEKWAVANTSVRQHQFYKNFVRQIQTQTVEEKNVFTFKNSKDARKFISQEVKAKVSGITKIPAGKIREDATFKSMGIDSLMALQLKNKIQETFRVNLNVSSIWSHPTVEKYSDYLSEEMKLTEHYDKPSEVPEKNKPASLEQEVESMSLEDLMKELSNKLDT
jgi:NAD(P)-dependent dehydrogenase (short-subunit alcohol dehydrogenase family)/acyl carrier protein